MRKTGGDIVGTGVNAVEAVPGIGNAISTVGAATMGAAGLGASALGYDEFAKTMYSGAEYNALNALPVVGNIRAAKAAAQDVGAVAGDLQGKPPEQNPSAQNDWEEGGQQKFNKSAGGLWDSYWQ